MVYRKSAVFEKALDLTRLLIQNGHYKDFGDKASQMIGEDLSKMYHAMKKTTDDLDD